MSRQPPTAHMCVGAATACGCWLTAPGGRHAGGLCSGHPLINWSVD